MSWIAATKNVNPDDPEFKRLKDEAITAAPIGYAKLSTTGEIISENSVAMLPRKPIRGLCRLCGKEDNLTKEHIPPAASGNKQRQYVLTFGDWLKDRMETNTGSKHKVEQGGIFGHTLCRSCNSLTGTLYGTEYKNWVEKAIKIIEGYGVGAIAQMNDTAGKPADDIAFGSKGSGSVKPGAFVRQVLSCMCSLSGTWDLAGRYPEIRRIILEQSLEALPDGMELGMSFYFGPRLRIMGPQLSVDMKTLTWRWCQEIAFPPFAFLFVIASNIKEPGLGLLIDKFTAISPDTQQYFSGIIDLGFGWTPYPGDYRSRATIISERKTVHNKIKYNYA